MTHASLGSCIASRTFAKLLPDPEAVTGKRLALQSSRPRNTHPQGSSSCLTEEARPSDSFQLFSGLLLLLAPRHDHSENLDRRGHVFQQFVSDALQWYFELVLHVIIDLTRQTDPSILR